MFEDVTFFELVVLKLIGYILECEIDEYKG